MRHSVASFLLILFVVLVYALASVWGLLSLLVVDGSSDAIPSAELDAPAEGRQELIPRIIHQTYADEAIPPHWELARRSCLALHTPEEGWEYKLWTDKTAREFVAAEYPYLLETFDGYKFPIQRADAIRYLVLAHFGGIYIDMDDGCNRKLDPLLAYPAWLRLTVPTGISNDVMGSVPHHPFFVKAIAALPRYDKNWLMPYITVMSSTGPLFLSLIWRHYNSDLGASLTGWINTLITGHSVPPEESQRVRIMSKAQYMGEETSFFTLHSGSSWHDRDAGLFFWMRDHWVLLLLVGIAVGSVAILRTWRVYRRFMRRCNRATAALMKQNMV